MNKSKKMEVNEMIKPNIIKGLDLTLSSFLSLFFEEGKFLTFFLLIRLGKGLITIKIKISDNHPKVLNKSLW